MAVLHACQVHRPAFALAEPDLAPEQLAKRCIEVRTARGQRGRLKQTFTGELVQGWIRYTL